MYGMEKFLENTSEEVISVIVVVVPMIGNKNEKILTMLENGSQEHKKKRN